MNERCVTAEVQYLDSDGYPVHSDLLGMLPDEFRKILPEWRAYLHSALDEWIDKSNGTGFFYIADPRDLREEFTEE